MSRARGLVWESLVLVAVSLLMAGCDRTVAPSSSSGASATSSAPAGAGASTAVDSADAPLLTEVTGQLGLKQPTESYPDGTFQTPEITPGGIALFDYDNDGRLDILQILHGPPGQFHKPVPNRLYHQEPDGTFKEVPNAGGLLSGGYA